MLAGIQNITLPMAAEQARTLELGSLVTVSGSLFTGRSRFHIRAVEDGVLPKIDFDVVNCFFHVGPVMRRQGGEWTVVSAEPTSSLRFDRYSADVIRMLNLRTVIGKTTMGARAAQALRETGGVYLSKIGVCGNLLAGQVRRVVASHFVDEIGTTEATWVFEVERFGPFFVGIDATGADYFAGVERQTTRRLPDVRRELGIDGNFEFTDVGPDAGAQ